MYINYSWCDVACFYIFSFETKSNICPFQNYRYLDLLSVLCVCDGVAIPDNQSYITENWLMKDQVSFLRQNLTSVELAKTFMMISNCKKTLSSPNLNALGVKNWLLIMCDFRVACFWLSGDRTLNVRLTWFMSPQTWAKTGNLYMTLLTLVNNIQECNNSEYFSNNHIII